MSLNKFALDFERFNISATVKENIIEFDYEEIQFDIDINEEWIKAINKIYKAKQYELNFDSKFQVSNSNVEFQVFKLTPSYIYKPYFEFSDERGDIVFLSNMSKEYQLNLFRSEEFNIQRLLERIKRKYASRSERIRKRRPRFHFRIDDLFLNFKTITYKPKKKIDREKLINIGREKCKSCLFKLAVSENDCWELRETLKGKGFHIPLSIEEETVLTIPKTQYEDDLIGFYKIANSSLFPSQSFLSYYHVIEYNFLRVADEDLYSKTKAIINATSFNSDYKNVNKLLSVLQKHEKNLDETSMFKGVINKYVDEEELIGFIQEIEISIGEKIYSKPKGEVFGEKMNIRLEEGHTIGNTAKVIKHIRNSLVHSSDKYTREECVVPFSISETIVTKYIPIIRFLSEKVIFACGK